MGRSKRSPTRHAPAVHTSGSPSPAVLRTKQLLGSPATALALVLLALVWLHASALRLLFFADDYLFLDQVRTRSLFGALTSPDPLRNFWRPVGRQLYFWLVVRLGETPLAAHAMNLLIFAGIVAMLFVLVRRLAGVRAATFAASLLALHYAADVPVRWVSGSQDLIAVAGALGALCLLTSGHRMWAAVALVLGLLAKETVLVTPLVAVAMVRRPGEPWHRGVARVWPLAAAALAWAVLWVVAMRGRTGGTVSFSADAIPAAMVHLVQVLLGAEWSRYAVLPALHVLPPLVPLGLVLAAVTVAWRLRGSRASAAAGQTPAATDQRVTGVVWAAAGALPVAAVVHIWSTYYYLFALCGLALLVGTLLTRVRLPVVIGALTLLVWGSENGRRLESFATAPSPWGTESHLTRFYFDRSMRWVTRYYDDLRSQRPTLPPRSTVFYSGTQIFAGWQAADGPLIRWAYRDSSLRSYYLSDFTAHRARRGPFFVFVARNDSLVEQPLGQELYLTLAATQALSDHFDVARDALAIGLERDPSDPGLHYWSAWIGLALGDTAFARRELRAAGCEVAAGPSSDVAAAQRMLSSGDTLQAARVLGEAVRTHSFDPRAHALLADLVITRMPSSSPGVMEALAARVLAPRDPQAWMRWVTVQTSNSNFEEALASLDRYCELAGPGSRADVRIRQLHAYLERSLPGGESERRSLILRPRSR
jgi:hypothetical protein